MDPWSLKTNRCQYRYLTNILFGILLLPSQITVAKMKMLMMRLHYITIHWLTLTAACFFIYFSRYTFLSSVRYALHPVTFKDFKNRTFYGILCMPFVPSGSTQTSYHPILLLIYPLACVMYETVDCFAYVYSFSTLGVASSLFFLCGDIGSPIFNRFWIQSWASSKLVTNQG